jgi:hypothetical protein
MLQAPSEASVSGGAAASPPPSVVFEMDYSSGAADLAGWNAGPDEAAYATGEMTTSRQAAIGPASEDGYRHTMVTPGTPPGGNFSFGWRTDFGSVAPFAYGDSVFFRFKYRHPSGVNGRYYNEEGVLTESGAVKVIIANDGSSSTTSRFILTTHVENYGTPQYFWRLQKGGGVDSGDSATYNVDTSWHALQLELQYSSSANAADGAYRLWRDNTTQGSPTIAVTGIVLNADVNPGYIQWGAYANRNVYSDGVYGRDECAFAIADAFTAGWSV